MTFESGGTRDFDLVVGADGLHSRLALVGDAAACPSLLAGQGSALAMVEAYVLAAELTRVERSRRGLRSLPGAARGFPALQAGCRGGPGSGVRAEE